MEFKIQQGRESFSNYGGAALIEKAINRLNFCAINNLCPTPLRSDAISFSDVFETLVYNQSFGNSHYHDIVDLNGDPLVGQMLGRPISEEIFRQKLNFLANQEGIYSQINNFNVTLLRSVEFPKISYNGNEYYPLDIDVTPMINEKVKKEGISYTYKKAYGYSPINAYLSAYGLCFDLREGSKHSENGAIEFLEKCLHMIDELNIPRSEIIVRVDSAHDDGFFINACINAGLKFIVKANHRKEKYCNVISHVVRNIKPESLYNGKKYYTYVAKNPLRVHVDKKSIYQVFEITEAYGEENPLMRYCVNLDPNQPVDQDIWKYYEIVSYYTNVDLGEVSQSDFDELKIAKGCIELYHNHATSEQYHSELKTDMNVCLLPSKYFATNSLILAASVISFNILRIIGNLSLELDSSLKPKKNKKKMKKRCIYHQDVRMERIRLSTVIDKFLKVVCRIISHARSKVIKFSRDYQYFNVFSKILARL